MRSILTKYVGQILNKLIFGPKLGQLPGQIIKKFEVKNSTAFKRNCKSSLRSILKQKLGQNSAEILGQFLAN